MVLALPPREPVELLPYEVALLDGRSRGWNEEKVNRQQGIGIRQHRSRAHTIMEKLDAREFGEAITKAFLLGYLAVESGVRIDLSAGQAAVFARNISGESQKEICEAQFTVPATVKRHRARALQKLQPKNRYHMPRVGFEAEVLLIGSMRSVA